MSAAAFICTQQERDRKMERWGEMGQWGPPFVLKLCRDFLYFFHTELNLVTGTFMTQFKWKPKIEKILSSGLVDDTFVTQKSMKYESVQAWERYSFHFKSSPCMLQLGLVTAGNPHLQGLPQISLMSFWLILNPASQQTFFPPSRPLFGVLCLCVSAAFQSAPGCQLIVDNYSYLTAAFTASPFCRHLERENMPSRGP